MPNSERARIKWMFTVERARAKMGHVDGRLSSLGSAPRSDRPDSRGAEDRAVTILASGTPKRIEGLGFAVRAPPPTPAGASSATTGPVGDSCRPAVAATTPIAPSVLRLPGGALAGLCRAHRFFPPKPGMAVACFIHDAAWDSSRSSQRAVWARAPCRART